MTNMTNKKRYETGSRNVFKDIGVPNAEEHLVKAQLVFKIDTIMKDRGLKQIEAADLFGIRQPDVSTPVKKGAILAGLSRSQGATRESPGRRGRGKNSTADSKYSCARKHSSRITRARRAVLHSSPRMCFATAPKVCSGSGMRETPDRCRVCQVNHFEVVRYQL